MRKYTYRQKFCMVQFLVVIFKVLCGFCGGGILILRQRNVCSDFSVSVLRFFTVCAVKCFKDCNTKMDHAELLS